MLISKSSLYFRTEHGLITFIFFFLSEADATFNKVNRGAFLYDPFENLQSRGGQKEFEHLGIRVTFTIGFRTVSY